MNRACPRCCLGIALLSLAIGLSGCGGGGSAPPEGRPATVPVNGKLTYNGEPVAGASVLLRLKGDGPGASGITDDKGEFKLTTFTAGDGAVPGTYLVGVVKSETVGADPSYGDVDSPNYGKTPPPGAEGKVVHHIPEKFNNPDTAGQTVTISAEDPNLTIELKD